MAFPRLHANIADCAHELINGESGIKGGTGEIVQIRLRKVAKNGIINNWGVPLNWNSRVVWLLMRGLA